MELSVLSAAAVGVLPTIKSQVLIGSRLTSSSIRRRRGGGVGVICWNGDCKLQMMTMITTSSRRRRIRRRGVGVICGAGGPETVSEFSRDAPFAIAIAASMFHTLFFPLSQPQHDDEDDQNDVIPTKDEDVKYPVMTIISLIPFFNWLSWVFAFMDTGNRRYAVYAAIYLAPYLRTNFSLSPDESWLPIASIILCIIHIQLEASIRSGDLDTFAFFHEAAACFGLGAKTKETHSATQHKFNKGRSMKLPSSGSQGRKWEDHKTPSQEAKHGTEDSDLDDEMDHH